MKVNKAIDSRIALAHNKILFFPQRKTILNDCKTLSNVFADIYSFVPFPQMLERVAYIWKLILKKLTNTRLYNIR